MSFSLKSIARALFGRTKQVKLNMRVILRVNSLDDRVTPAVLLPDGFTAGGGIFHEGAGEIVGGVYNNKPAYVTILPDFAPVVTVLPSLDVLQRGASGNPEGQIQEVVQNNDGDVMFIGYGRSPDTSILNAFGKGTTWRLGSTVATGYGNNTSSGFFAGNSSGLLVGNSLVGGAVYSNDLELASLPNNGSYTATIAYGVNSDGSIIIGVIDSNVVTWGKNSLGVYELMGPLESPTPGGPVGFANGIADTLTTTFGAGQYWDPVLEAYCARVWDLGTGKMQWSFDSFGGVGTDTPMLRDGNEVITVFNSTEGKPPLVVVYNVDTGAMRSFSLDTVAGVTIGSIAEVRDIYVRPEGSLGLAYQGTDGKFYCEALAVNDQGKPWGGYKPNTAPSELTLTGNSVSEDALVGAVVGSFSATDPDVGDKLTYTLVSAGSPFTIVGNQLVTTRSLDFEVTPSYSVTAKVTDAAGASAEKMFTVNVTDVVETVPPVPPVVPPTVPPVVPPVSPPTTPPVVPPVVPPVIPPVLPPGSPPTVPPIVVVPPVIVLPPVPPTAPVQPQLLQPRLLAQVFGNGNVTIFDTTGAVRGQLNTGYGVAVSVALGDVDGDGQQELIVGAPRGFPALVRIYNLDGSLKQTIEAYLNFLGGVTVTTGDINGDGAQEVITGALAGGGPHVRIFDLRNNLELASFFAYDKFFIGGISISAGDIDGDGKAELVTGAGPGGGPHVKIYSGAELVASGSNPQAFSSFFAYDSGFRGGVYVALGDLNGDGTRDLITGAGAGGGPHVRMIDGRSLGQSGQELKDLGSIYATNAQDTRGVEVISHGVDLDGDGTDEILLKVAQPNSKKLGILGYLSLLLPGRTPVVSLPPSFLQLED